MTKIMLIITLFVLLVGCQVAVEDGVAVVESSEEKEISDALDDLEEINSLGNDLGDDVSLDELDDVVLE